MADNILIGALVVVAILLAFLAFRQMTYNPAYGPGYYQPWQMEPGMMYGSGYGYSNGFGPGMMYGYGPGQLFCSFISPQIEIDAPFERMYWSGCDL